MALLTRAGINKLFRRILETGGLTDAMEEDIKRLQDDFDEREGILKKYGETYDGEDADEYEFAEREIESTDDYKDKYEAMKQKYLDRFFGGVEVEVEVEPSEPEEEKVEEELSINDLFKEE